MTDANDCYENVIWDAVQYNLHFACNANTLRIICEVEKNLTKETNKSKLSLFNLVKARQKKLEMADLKHGIAAHTG